MSEQTARFNYDKCDAICNQTIIYPAMQQLVDKEKMSIRAAARFVEEDSSGRVTQRRARMVYRNRRGGSVDPPPEEPTDSDQDQIEDVDEEEFDFEEEVEQPAQRVRVVEETTDTDQGFWPDSNATGKRKRARPESWRSSLEVAADKLDAVIRAIATYSEENDSPADEDDEDQLNRILNQVPRLVRCLIQWGFDLDKLVAAVTPDSKS